MSIGKGTADVTGRDRHIILKALAIAIEAISAVPQKQQPLSDQDDMKKLLQAMAPSDVELAVYQRSAHWVIHGQTSTPDGG
jgi:hypothetical protein